MDREMICNSSCGKGYCYHAKIHKEHRSCPESCDEHINTTCRPATELEIVMARLIGKI